MTTLKNKIKIIPSLPNKIKKKQSIKKILLIFTLVIMIFIGIYFAIKSLLPYINAIKIEKIKGKKISITECNTKDYIIINTDKTFSLKLTNNNCIINEYEGNYTIKNNEIYLKYIEKINNKEIKKEIKGIIDINNNYNIIINNNKFESEKNE